MDAAFADAKDDLLGAVDDLIDFQALIVGNLGDLAGGGNQPAQDGGSFDDARVVINIERGRRAGDQISEIGGATHIGQAAAALQLIDQGDKVKRFAPFVERIHGFIEPGVALAEEIFGAQKVGNFDDRIGIDHQ